MVPPEGLYGEDEPESRRLREQLFSRTAVYGTSHTATGIPAIAARVNADEWLREGGGFAQAQVIKFGVGIPLVSEVPPYHREPSGNYTPFMEDPVLNAVAQRGWNAMKDFGGIHDEINFRPHVNIPQFSVRQPKDDGTVKERGIQNGTACGINGRTASFFLFLLWRGRHFRRYGFRRPGASA